MIQRLPSLNALKAFEAAGRHLSFTKAASELHVTQSAISHQIKMLEEDLGVRMFLRDVSRLVLTPEAQQLLPVLTTLFAQMNAAVNAVRVSGKQRPLHVVLRPYFAQKWLIPRLEKFWSAYPDINLQLVHSIALPDFSQASLGIVWIDQPPPDWEAIELINGDLTPVCSPQTLARYQRPITPEDLANELLLDEESPANWDAWLTLAGMSGMTPRRRISIDDTNVRIRAARDGQGFVLTTLALLETEIAAGQLVAPFTPSLRKYSYYLVYPKQMQLRREIRDFVDWILQQARPA